MSAVDRFLGACGPCPEELSSFVDAFRSELSAYGELIVGAQTRGLLVRGAGSAFGARVGAWLAGRGAAPEALAHAAWLSELFEHRNVFFKVECGGGTAKAGLYVRRRPRLDDLAARFGDRVAATVWDELRSWAATLHKDTAHFVAAEIPLRGADDAPCLHKLYVSQPWDPAHAAAITARVAAWVPAADRAGWRRAHAATRPTALFVSRTFTAERVSDSIKVDYGGIGAEEAAGFGAVDPADVAALAAGGAPVAYVGVRYRPGARPTVKLYASTGTDVG